jgi:ABC-2 type transport system ATP-binding protein
MMNAILEVNNLTKWYGNLKALDGLSFVVNRGEVFGILGPNGSGKTTTLGILLGIIKKNGGSFSWFGQKPSATLRKNIGALLETPLFYPYLSAVNNLKIIADIKGSDYSQIDELLKLVDLHERKKSKFKTFSLGMRQRLAIAAAMINNPDVLILDEPTNGLDPQGIADIRNLILRIASKGTTIILASHILNEVEKTCTHVAVLNQGKKLYSGRVDEVINSSGFVELSCDDNEKLLEIIKQKEWFEKATTTNDNVLVTLKKPVETSAINRELAEAGIYLSHLALQKKSLEKYFLELLSEEK